MQNLLKWALLLILFAPILFLCFKQKKWYLCLLFAFTSFLPDQFALRLHDSLPLISVSRLLILLVMIFWVWNGIKHRRFHFPLSIITYLALNLIISIINLQYNFGEVNRIFLLVFERVFLVIAVADLVDGKEDLYICLDFMILGSVAVSIIAIIQAIFNFDIASVMHWVKTTGSVKIPDRMGLERAYGTFNAISFGCYCAFMLLPIYFRIERTGKLRYSAAFALTVIAMICTLTRSAWLCSAIVLFILAILQRKRFFKAILPAAALTLILCVGLCFAQPKLYAAFLETGKTTINTVLSIFPTRAPAQTDTPSTTPTGSEPATTATEPATTATEPTQTTISTDPSQTIAPTEVADPTAPASSIVITKQPESVLIPEGLVASVSFSAEGKDLTYQWFYKNETDTVFEPTEAFKGPEYAVKMDGSRNGRQLYCVITDTYGNQIQTDTVTLTRESVPLEIVEQPVSITVSANKKATVQVTAIGDDLTYRWYYASKNSNDFKLTESFTSNVYSIPMTPSRAGRQVYCVITDKTGSSVQSNTVVLNMDPKSSNNIFEIDESFGLNQDNALNSRNMQWSAVEYMAKEGQLLFGYGYDAYNNGKLHYKVEYAGESVWIEAHAIDVGLVSLFTESGLIGFLTLLTLLSYMLIVSLVRRSKGPEFDFCKLTLLLIPLYLMINYASSFLNKPIIWLLFALFYAHQKVSGYPLDKCIRLSAKKD